MRQATNEEKRITNTILDLYGLRNDERLKAIIESIIESIIVNGGTGNYSKDIYPYIREYYPKLYNEYGAINQNFKGRVNAKVQSYTGGMSNFGGTEIFESKGKGTGTFSLVYKYQK